MATIVVPGLSLTTARRLVREGWRAVVGWGRWRSLALGIGSCLGAYALLVVAVGQLLILPDPIGGLAALLNVELPHPPTIAAWLFYTMHGVALWLPTGVDLVAGPVGGPGSGLIVEPVTPLDSGCKRLGMLYPPVALGIAALIAGRRAALVRAGAVSGTVVGLGYACVLLVGVAFARFTIDVNIGAIDVASFTIRVVLDRRFVLGTIVAPTIWATLTEAIAATDWPDRPS